MNGGECVMTLIIIILLIGMILTLILSIYQVKLKKEKINRCCRHVSAKCIGKGRNVKRTDRNINFGSGDSGHNNGMKISYYEILRYTYDMKEYEITRIVLKYKQLSVGDSCDIWVNPDSMKNDEPELVYARHGISAYAEELALGIFGAVVFPIIIFLIYTGG